MESVQAIKQRFGIIGNTPALNRAIEKAIQVAPTDISVLVTGESGVGKESIPKIIHQLSHRKHNKYIAVNCGAIPEGTIDSELFGHEKGAFTGATADRKGRFLLADKGTIFLDEIGELPLQLQPKLLRVIQEGEFDPVGSSETVKVDVRIIAATHRNLLEHTQNGKFREDLYYRLNVFPIEIPALRDRGNDICLIAEEMILQQSKKLGKPSLPLSDTDKSLLLNYQWPGNVRELQNLIERAIIVSNNGNINWQAIIPNTVGTKTQSETSVPDTVLTSHELLVLEKENILKALRQTKWKISGKHGAAELLQLKPTTLASKIKALGIERPI